MTNTGPRDDEPYDDEEEALRGDIAAALARDALEDKHDE